MFLNILTCRLLSFSFRFFFIPFVCLNTKIFLKIIFLFISVVHDNLGQEDQVYRPEGGVQQYSTVVQQRPAQSLYPGVPVVKNTVQHSG